jgi:hypothetical protein
MVEEAKMVRVKGHLRTRERNHSGHLEHYISRPHHLLEAVCTTRNYKALKLISSQLVLLSKKLTDVYIVYYLQLCK